MSVNRERLVQGFTELVKIDSPSLNEREIADHITERCSKMMLSVFEDESGRRIGGNTGNLVIRKKGSRDKPVLLLMAHMDNVPPCKGIRPVIEGDIIKSDGSTVLGADDKAGIAVILEALDVLIEDDIEHGDLEIVFTVAEEVGLLGAAQLDHSRLAARYAIILDSNGKPGVFVTKAPYQSSFEIMVKGRAAHAGVEPEKGISAIKLASDAIAAMPFGRIDDETTLNVGYINGGGASNIVTEKVQLRGEVRSREEVKMKALEKQIADIFNDTAAKHGGSAETVFKPAYQGYSLDPDKGICRIFKTAAEKCGLEAVPMETGGGSDTNHVNEAGIEGVDIGIGVEAMHSVNEYIRISDLEAVTGLLLEMIRQI